MTLEDVKDKLLPGTRLRARARDISNDAEVPWHDALVWEDRERNLWLLSNTSTLQGYGCSDKPAEWAHTYMLYDGRHMVWDSTLRYAEVDPTSIGGVTWD